MSKGVAEGTLVGIVWAVALALLYTRLHRQHPNYRAGDRQRANGIGCPVRLVPPTEEERLALEWPWRTENGRNPYDGQPGTHLRLATPLEHYVVPCRDYQRAKALLKVADAKIRNQRDFILDTLGVTHEQFTEALRRPRLRIVQDQEGVKSR